MPVKVRCPECEKVLTLPDQARGKAVKCPQCEARVPVPKGQASGRAPQKAAAGAAKSGKAPRPPAEADDDLLANLDLTRAEDRGVRVCPKCGLEVTEEDFECPKCGVELTTGRLSELKRKKKERGGPDTDKYYERFLSDGWEFVKEHWMLGLRTVIYLLVLAAVFVLSAFMTLYCAKMPLKVFWAVIGLLAVLVAPGWCWFLHTTIINAAIDKKQLLNRVRFDFFTSAALGIKFYCWLVVFCAPFLLVFGTIGGLMISNDTVAGGIAVIALGFLPAFFCFPAAMANMAMPVQWPGWLSPRIIPQYFQGLAKASLYWNAFFIATMLPTLIFWLIIGLAFQEDLVQFADDLDHNARVDVVMAYEPPKTKAGSGEETVPVEAEITTEFNRFSWWIFASDDQIEAEKEFVTQIPEEERLREVQADLVVGPAILLLLSCVPFGFAAVFNMRTNGLLTFYYRPELQLIAEEKELKYVAKEKEYDDEGRVIEKADMAKYAMGFGGTILFYVVVNVIMYFATGGEYLLLPRPLARALNLME